MKAKKTSKQPEYSKAQKDELKTRIIIVKRRIREAGINSISSYYLRNHNDTPKNDLTRILQGNKVSESVTLRLETLADILNDMKVKIS